MHVSTFRKPLHTIEESNELLQNDLNNLNSSKYWETELSEITDPTTNFDDQDSLLLEIRNLFIQSERQELFCSEDFYNHKNIQKSEYHENQDFSPEIEGYNLRDCFSDCLSPSFSLIQQFELAAKEEAAIVLQCCYRRFRERRRFLRLKKSAVVIQRSFRAWQGQEN